MGARKKTRRTPVLKRIPDLDGPRVHIGSYFVSYFDNDSFWLENLHGEGIQVPHADIDLWLRRYWLKNY